MCLDSSRNFVFFILTLTNFSKMLKDAFARYLIEEESKIEYEEVVLQFTFDRPVFQSDVDDTKELASKEVTRKLERTVEGLSTDNIVKSAMNKETAKISSTKSLSAIKLLVLV